MKAAREGTRTIIALADGAGGMSGAEEAAEQVVWSLMETFLGGAVAVTPRACAEALATTDQAVASNPRAGESTGLLVVIEGDSIVGASVGDCAAWVVPQGDEPLEITVRQMRKPRIGTGRANPVAFGPVPLNGVLVAVTDGVADYLTGGHLTVLVRHAASEQLPKTLLDHVRLPSGNLPDHATVVVVSRHNEVLHG